MQTGIKRVFFYPHILDRYKWVYDIHVPVFHTRTCLVKRVQNLLSVLVPVTKCIYIRFLLKGGFRGHTRRFGTVFILQLHPFGTGLIFRQGDRRLIHFLIEILRIQTFRLKLFSYYKRIFTYFTQNNLFLTN